VTLLSCWLIAATRPWVSSSGGRSPKIRRRVACRLWSSASPARPSDRRARVVAVPESYLDAVQARQGRGQPVDDLMLQADGQLAPLVLLQAKQSAQQPLAVRLGPPQRGHVVEQ
jgi:hypothetical protein